MYTASSAFDTFTIHIFDHSSIMKSILTILSALLPFVVASSISLARANVRSKSGPNTENNSCKKGESYNVNLSFPVNVPTGADTIDVAPTIDYDGYRFTLPYNASSGLLVSFLGNFDMNQTMTSQIVTISNSTSIEGKTSYSNASATANTTTIVAMTYSSGNSSS